MVEAGVQAGYPRTDDLNGYQQEGFGPMDRTVTPQGRRSSTARGYLDMAKGRDNLTIITHAMTNRILFNRNKAIGVEYFEGQNTLQPIQVFADREVLLCAGAIASPQILQRSGVGPAELLKSLDIPVVQDLPGVGENLQDHLEMYLQYKCKKPVSLYPALKWYNQPMIGAEWLFLGKGIGASNQFEAGGFIRSSDEFEWPNIQYHFLPVAINYNGTNAIHEHGFQAHVGSMRSPSRGRVRLKSKDPFEHPSILFNYMSTEQDWREFGMPSALPVKLCISPPWIHIVVKKSVRAKICKLMQKLMNLFVIMQKQRIIRPVAVKWVRMIWPLSMVMGVCMRCKACVSSMLQLCRSLLQATSMQPRS